ncbi:MAG: histidine kinase [Eubacteriales bacterium]|nr:histidine kinase [Eubacteriales bacterium]
MWTDKKKHLRSAYFGSFIALIVVPILAVIVISMMIIRVILTDAAVKNIQSAQRSMATALGSEVQDVSLRLSHFVYVNNNEIVRTAARTDTEDVSERYHYTKILGESFEYAMVPVQDILSAVFYMKSGRFTYLKDDVILSREELEQADWYQEALADKNMVKIGYYDRGITTSRKNSHMLIIAAALSPGVDVDRDGVIEMAALFTTSRVGTMMKDGSRDPALGQPVLLDRKGRVLLDPSNAASLLKGMTGESGDVSGFAEEEPERIFLEDGQLQRRINGKKYVCIVTEEPVTGCRFVNIAAADVLTRQFNPAAAAILAVTVFLFALFYMFSVYFLKNIVEPVHRVVEGMKQVEQGELEVHVEPSGQEELRTMVHSFNRMVRRLNTLITENADHQQKKHEAEIRALQSQINPHFLVNALSSIRFIAQVSHFDSIGKMAEALMKILSCSFRSNTGFYTLGEELDVLDGFIYLMKIRYSDGFDIAYEIDEDCRDCLVPRLILQPVVENSIVHGFEEMMEDIGQIRLTARIQDGFLVIAVEDNGKGMTKERIRQVLEGAQEDEADGREGTGVGIRNVNARLILNFGDQSGLVMESQPGAWTRTVMRIPVKRKENR